MQRYLKHALTSFLMAFLGLSTTVFADEYPVKPIKIYVGQGAGGGMDSLTHRGATPVFAIGASRGGGKQGGCWWHHCHRLCGQVFTGRLQLVDGAHWQHGVHAHLDAQLEILRHQRLHTCFYGGNFPFGVGGEFKIQIQLGG